MNGELGVMGSLNRLIDDTVDDTQGVEVQLHTVDSAVRNLLVFFVEMVEELPMLDQFETNQMLKLTAGP